MGGGPRNNYKIHKNVVNKLISESLEHVTRFLVSVHLFPQTAKISVK